MTAFNAETLQQILKVQTERAEAADALVAAKVAEIARLTKENEYILARMAPDANPDDPSVNRLNVQNSVAEWMRAGYRLHAHGAIQNRLDKLQERAEAAERRVAEFVKPATDLCEFVERTVEYGTTGQMYAGQLRAALAKVRT